MTLFLMSWFTKIFESDGNGLGNRSGSVTVENAKERLSTEIATVKKETTIIKLCQND